MKKTLANPSITSFFEKLLYHRSLVIFLILAAFVIFFSLATYPKFTSESNLKALARLMPDLGIITLGVGLLMICGEFDLSVSANVPLSSFVFVKLIMGGAHPALAMICALLVGTSIGFLNGVITVKTGLHSFIVTLGTMMLWRGILYVYSKMMPLSITYYLPKLTWFVNALSGELGGVLPVQVLWFGFFAALLGVILHYHKFGNWVYATGGNKEAAREMGINTDLTKVICFTIVGFLCAFVGLIEVARLRAFSATQGIGFELKAIAGAVLGGTSLFGGIGSMTGVVLGAVALQVLDTGLIILGVPCFAIDTFTGLIVVLFAIINLYTEKRLLRVR